MRHLRWSEVGAGSIMDAIASWKKPDAPSQKCRRTCVAAESREEGQARRLVDGLREDTY